MWTKLDDDLHDNPKALELSANAGWLITRMWSYCGRHGTDGHISVAALRTLWHEPGTVEELIAKGWLHERGREAGQCSHARACSEHLPADKTGGWVVHDYLDRNPSQDENEVKKAKDKERKSSRLRTLVFARDGGLCRYCARLTNRNDHTSGLAFHLDHVSPEHALGAGGVVTACRDCNDKKGARRPSDAGMRLLPPPKPLEPGVDDPTLHLAELDPNASRGSDPAPVGVVTGSGRDGSGRVGSALVESALLGSPKPLRALVEDNPFLRSGRIDHDADPAFAAGPAPPPPPADSPPPRQARPARPARKRKRRRR